MLATERFTSSIFSAHDVACKATRHTHADEETAMLPTIVIPRRGVFRWTSGTATVIAEPNTVLLFEPENSHRITHPTDHGDDCTALRFSHAQIRDVLGLSRSPRHWILDAESQFTVHLAVHAIRRASDALQGEEAGMLILQILAGSCAPRKPSHRAVDLVRERIAADPTERATLPDLARTSGLSPYELARRFRASTGSSIHQHRLRQRLLIAMSRLQDGADDLTSLALDLGFSSHAHFSAAFARAVKMPPQQYRRLANRR